MSKPNYISGNMREILVDYLSEVHIGFRLKEKAFFKIHL